MSLEPQAKPSLQDLSVISEPELTAEAQDPQDPTQRQMSLALALAEEDLYDRIGAREQRGLYARRIFRLVRLWLVLVGYTVLAQGFGVGIHAYGRFHLSDTVLIALLTTTTATVIGALLIVLNHVFPRRQT